MASGQLSWAHAALLGVGALTSCATASAPTCTGVGCDMNPPIASADLPPVIQPDGGPPVGTDGGITASSGWTWMAGSNAHDPAASYGTVGVAAPTNTPGGRGNSSVWVDSGGAHLWGGVGTAPGVGPGSIDGWRWGGAAWTWENGPNNPTYPVFGTKGTPAATNTPGSRTVRITHDIAGHGFLFGGIFKEVINTPYTGMLTLTGPGNDLWKWDGTNWTWVAGTGLYAQGKYGTKGTAASTNVPGGRSDAFSWIDVAQRFYVFGGLGLDSGTDNVSAKLNDLWRWDGTNWTWLAGATVRNGVGVYGVLGTPTLTTTPGARAQFSAWVDATGGVWIFGGHDAVDSAGAPGLLNDLWKWNGTMWTWVAGGKLVNQAGVYGVKGMAASTNTPGARGGAAVFADAAGIVWMFGGNGYDSTGMVGNLNDLWKWDGTMWTFMNGSQTAGQSGSFGAVGVAAASNMPSARTQASIWIDSAKALWLFGGVGKDATGQVGTLNDVWTFH